MTVGELIYQEAIKDGYNPEEISPELKKVAEAYQRAFDVVREPMKAVVTSVMETMQEPIKRAVEAASSMAKALEPQMEAISKIKLPTLPTYHSYIPDSFYDEEGELLIYSAFTRPIQEVRIVNPEDIAVAPTRRESDIVTASYLLPQNATWEALSIRFIDGHFVQLSYPNMESRKFDYKDMGFVNMKTTNPDLKWQLLRAIADNGGALTNKRWNGKFGRNIKYELNEGLKRFFGMEENPIPHYTKGRGYAPLFSLRGEK